MSESTTDAQQARRRRRRNRRVRQTIVFGSLAGVLAVVLGFSYGIYSGTISGPFNIEFTSDDDGVAAPTPPPCPAEEDMPVPYSDVEMRVFNTTDVSGLAAAAGDAFVERGFDVSAVSNDDASIIAAAELRFGPHAIAQAYTIEAQLEGAQMRLDETRTDTVVDVLVGDAYDDLKPVELVDLVPDEPFPPLPDCVPVTIPDEVDSDAELDDTEVPPQDDEEVPEDSDAAEDSEDAAA